MICDAERRCLAPSVARDANKPRLKCWLDGAPTWLVRQHLHDCAELRGRRENDDQCPDVNEYQCCRGLSSSTRPGVQLTGLGSADEVQR